MLRRLGAMNLQPRRGAMPHSSPLLGSLQMSNKNLAVTNMVQFVVIGLFLLAFGFLYARMKGAHGDIGSEKIDVSQDIQELQRGPVFISYSYFEKDPIQKQNFDFFLLNALSSQHGKRTSTKYHYFIVISGSYCTPCEVLEPLLGPKQASELDGITWTREGEHFTLLKKTENIGMDFAAHNTSMSFAMAQPHANWPTYQYFIFLNSSVKGPFVPKYYPYHWSEAYLSRLTGNVKAVSSSIVCLPAIDLGGPGARMESWAFAMDRTGLEVVLRAGVFHLRECKTCADGVVVHGEYGLSIALLREGFNFDTLMYKYGEVDWGNSSNWGCNNQVHPSRHGTYDGISMNPFEVVFLKASWHVGEPFADKYAAWQTTLLQGGNSAAGSFDRAMYHFAITPQAQEKHPFIEKAYQVGPNAQSTEV